MKVNLGHNQRLEAFGQGGKSSQAPGTRSDLRSKFSQSSFSQSLKSNSQRLRSQTPDSRNLKSSSLKTSSIENRKAAREQDVKRTSDKLKRGSQSKDSVRRRKEKSRNSSNSRERASHHADDKSWAFDFSGQALVPSESSSDSLEVSKVQNLQNIEKGQNQNLDLSAQWFEQMVSAQNSKDLLHQSSTEALSTTGIHSIPGGFELMSNSNTNTAISLANSNFELADDQSVSDLGLEGMGAFAKDFSEEGLKEDLQGGHGESTADFLSGSGKTAQKSTNATSAQFLKALNEVQSSPGEGKIDNLPSVIRSLQSTISDGGGAMKIQLSPEGMGHVNLNISVEDGHVNVEMTAENKGAKVALEDSLADIKHALEGQKLIVDTLKVELNRDLEKDFSNSQNFLADQQNRDLAQQFMEQFQQDREERTAYLFNGFRSYLREPADPDTVLDRMGLYRSTGQGRRLNVVA